MSADRPVNEILNFNSRPPHGGRRGVQLAEYYDGTTSTHDLHTEVDDSISASSPQTGRTSTHDLHTEVDNFFLFYSLNQNTSTHDLHTEVDLLPGLYMSYTTDFNSRPPHGGRRIEKASEGFSVVLQLTTSTRRSTAIFHKIAKNILSHLQHFSYQIPYLTHFPLPSSASLPLFHLYFWCESPGIFCSLHIRTRKLMSHSHQN